MILSECQFAVQRLFSTSKSTLGILVKKGIAQPLCFILEDPHQDVKIMGETRIPEGIYELRMRDSLKYTAALGHQVIEITGIPTHAYVYFHPGNTSLDTKGCVLPGYDATLLDHQHPQVLMSRRAYFDIYPILRKSIEEQQTFCAFLDERPWLRKFSGSFSLPVV